MNAIDVAREIESFLRYVLNLEEQAEEMSEEIVKLSDENAKLAAELEKIRPITTIESVIDDLPF